MANPKNIIHQPHATAAYPNPAEDDPRLLEVMALARACEVESRHTLHVHHLALRLFDDLAPLRYFGEKDRFLLQCAALLHDIGWVEGWRGHHKAGLAIILRTPLLTFPNKERLVIGSVVRYHRRALPQPDHDNYAALNLAEQELVKRLAAFLRIADGLDDQHQQRVEYLGCEVNPEEVVLICKAAQPAEDERTVALEKSDLFEQVFERRISITWSQAQ